MEYNLEYSGLPHQCGRCRGYDHLVRNCPKKFPPVIHKEVLSRNKIVEQKRSEPAKKLEVESLVHGKKVATKKEQAQCSEDLREDSFNTDLVKGKKAVAAEEQTPENISLMDGKKVVPTKEKAQFQEDTREDSISAARVPCKEAVTLKSTEQVQGSEDTWKENITLSPNNAGMQDRLFTHDATSQKPVSSDVLQTKSSLASPEASCNSADRAKNVASDDQTDCNNNMFQPDDLNFPKLQTPTSAVRKTSLNQEASPASKSKEPQFVWRAQNVTKSVPKTHAADGGKQKEKIPESTPLTRQGYRTGRLAEDFWSALGTPNTPVANPKKLRVIPFLTKNRHVKQAEYLVDRRGQTFGAIAYVQIAEVLAGIPWTQIRARQHVVNEVSQALQFFLIFNNNLSNPFQRWNQGLWYAQWGQEEGECICTLYVSIDVPEQKVKPRKGNNMGWRREPMEVTIICTSHMTEDIQVVAADLTLWQVMVGRLPILKTMEQMPPESHNRFASLLEEEAAEDQ